MLWRAVGEWLREWWRSTAPKLSIVDGRTPHEGRVGAPLRGCCRGALAEPADAVPVGYARVLGRYGVLNWLLFGWA